MKKYEKRSTRFKGEDKGILSQKPLPHENSGYEDVTSELYIKTREIISEESAARASNYLEYLWIVIRSSSLYGLVRRGVVYLRRIRLVGRIISVTSYILLLLRAGTVIILYLLFFALAIPIFLLLAAIFPILSLITSSRTNRFLKEATNEKKIYIFHPMRDSGFEASRAFIRGLSDILSDPDSAVLVVSPFFLKFGPWAHPEDINLARFAEEGRAFCIKKYYYFIFRNKVLAKHRKNVIHIY